MKKQGLNELSESWWLLPKKVEGHCKGGHRLEKILEATSSKALRIVAMNVLKLLNFHASIADISSVFLESMICDLVIREECYVIRPIS